MIVTLIFLDESGDTGFQFQSGSSRYFVVVMVIFEQPVDAERVNAAIAALREELRLPRRYEFRFSTGAKTRIREAFFKALLPYPFHYRALVVNKELFLARHGRDAEYKLFESIVVELFLSAREIRDAALFVDRITGGDFEWRLNIFLRQKMKARGLRPVRKFKHVDSKENSLIQVADMISGAVFHAYAREDDTYRRIIRSKEEILIEK